MFNTGLKITLVTALTAFTPLFAGAVTGSIDNLNTFLEGSSQSQQLAHLTDTDKSATASNISVVVNWGDGTFTPGIVAGSNGAFTVSGTHQYAEERVYGLSLAPSDRGNQNATIGGSTHVDDAPLVITAAATLNTVEGSIVNGTLASLTDLNPNALASDFSSIVNWGDGTSSAGVVTSSGGGKFQISGAHAYAEAGNYTLGLNTLDQGGSNVLVNGPVNVADASLTSGAAISNVGVEGSVINATVATFTDANASAPVSDFSSVIDWGDGTSSAGTVSSAGSGAFRVAGSHAYSEAGQYSVGVSTLDQDGALAKVSDTMLISDAALKNPLFAPLSKSMVTGTIATFMDNNPGAPVSDFSAFIDWGDGTTSAGTVSATNGLFGIGGSHTYVGPGNFAIQLKVSDVDGSTLTFSGTDRVNSPTPEPASLLLCAAGIVFLACNRKRKSTNGLARNRF